MAVKDKLKTDLFPTIWCPGCGIGLIMQQLASVMDELDLNKMNTVLVTGIGCTGRMGSYLKHESVYTLHGRTLPVAEAIKTVRPEMNVIVVSGDGDTASIGGNHLLHSIRRNPNITVLCNNNEIYGLTGGQTGPTTPQGTTTISSPAGAAYSPINLQGLVNTNPNAYYAKTTVYHQGPMRKAIKEAIQWPGFSLHRRRQPVHREQRPAHRLFASAYEMLEGYKADYKPGPRDATHLEPHQLGIVKGEPVTVAAAAPSGKGQGE